MRILLLLLCLANFLHSYGQVDSGKIYIMDPRIQIHSLRDYTSILVDPTNEIPEENILKGNLDGQFEAFRHIEVKPKTTYWISFNLQPSSDFKNWMIILRDTGNLYLKGAAFDYSDTYFLTADRKLINHQRSGPLVPRSQKSVPRFTLVNATNISGTYGQSMYVYIKMYNGNLLPPHVFYPQVQDPIVPIVTQNKAFYIMSAVALFFSLVSFFFFFFVRERSYLFFAIYSLVLSQHYLILDPEMVFIDIFIPEHPQLVSGFWRFFTIGGLILFNIFGRSFMNLPRIAPKTDKWYRVFLLVLSALVILDTAALMIAQEQIIPDKLFYSFIIVMLGFIIRFAFLKSILAKLYVAGAFWLILFTVLGILHNMGVISMFINPWPIGQFGQFLIYAAALAYKIRLNERTRAEAMRIREMDEIKSKFFANISHEFRTPLTLIQGPLQQIEEQANDREKQNGTVPVPWRQLKTMRRNTDRLLELVNQLLDLSRLDSGKMKLQIIKGDVLQLLKTLAASFESMAERKQIHYHIHFPEQTHIAFFDKDKLEKIFVNLLSNAFKYTPEKGTVSVIVTMENGRMRISVEDNGPGIAKKELDKVFDRFYQAEGTEDKGSGIGLALVKELVELYRGQVSVTSDPGSGSRFRVSLPFEKSMFQEQELVYGEWQSQPAFVNRSEDAPVENGINGAGNTNLPLLLVVEDNNDLRQFIIETVAPHYQVVEAKNGKEGYDLAITEIPDIIVSDVMMPLMNGFVLTKKLKNDERTSHIPVILLTAKADQQHKIEGLETGADDYLTKPFDAKELLARTSNLVHQRKLLRKRFAGSIQLKVSEVAVKSLDEIFLANVMEAIEKNMEEDDFGVEELAGKVAMSRSQLHRKLVALIGRAPSELLRQTRLLRAKELLEKKAFTPSEVAFKVGFNSHTYFSKCFKEEFGVSPGEA